MNPLIAIALALGVSDDLVQRYLGAADEALLDELVIELRRLGGAPGAVLALMRQYGSEAQRVAGLGSRVDFEVDTRWDGDLPAGAMVAGPDPYTCGGLLMFHPNVGQERFLKRTEDKVDAGLLFGPSLDLMWDSVDELFEEELHETGGMPGWVAAEGIETDDLLNVFSSDSEAVRHVARRLAERYEGEEWADSPCLAFELGRYALNDVGQDGPGFTPDEWDGPYMYSRQYPAEGLERAAKAATDYPAIRLMLLHAYATRDAAMFDTIIGTLAES